jgi:hypothetical protein
MVAAAQDAGTEKRATRAASCLAGVDCTRCKTQKGV